MTNKYQELLDDKALELVNDAKGEIVLDDEIEIDTCSACESDNLITETFDTGVLTTCLDCGLKE